MPGQNALDLRVVETITHGWDLSQALGMPVTFDPDLVERSRASGPARKTGWSPSSGASRPDVPRVEVYPRR